jgi:hypothetical protein
MVNPMIGPEWRFQPAVPTGGGEAVRSTNHEGTFRFSDEIKAIQSFLE